MNGRKKEFLYDATMSEEPIYSELERFRNPEKAIFLKRFFKTGAGEYGEGDQLMGISVPEIRKIAKKYTQTPLAIIEKILDNPFHEIRLTAGIILTYQYARITSDSMRKNIVDLYMNKRDRFNNWDLVDASCHKILGPWFLSRDKKPLEDLLCSPSIWDRRIAMITTYRFIKYGDTATCTHFAKKLLRDPEDLIHKAVGWMLREAGKVDIYALRSFLDEHVLIMPRTMLRYAIERLPEIERRSYLERKPDLPA